MAWRMGLFKQFFTWWDSATWGTRFFTWRRGESVGEDSQGNRYFREKIPSREGAEADLPTGGGRKARRRWVIYNGEAEASRVPPEWHAWLHYIVEEPPSVAPLPTKPWEQEHRPNLTGTPHAYHPPGSLLTEGARRPSTGDYEAWRPDE